MAEQWRWVACTSCRMIGFDVKQHIDSGEILIECRNCQASLLRSAPPETLKPQQPGGSNHAPAGGPYRV